MFSPNSAPLVPRRPPFSSHANPARRARLPLGSEPTLVEVGAVRQARASDILSTRNAYKIRPGWAVPGRAWERRRRCSPLTRRPFFSGFVTPLEALRPLWRIVLRRGGPKNPAKSRLLQCCASNRGRGGRQLTMPLAGPAAPRPRARGTRPLELSLGDRRSLDRAHVDISADLASAIVKGVPANFSRSASPRRAIWVMTNRVPQAKGPKQKADGSRMLRAVSQTRRPVAIRVTDLGEPRRLPRVRAKVPRLNRHRPFALGRGNASSCRGFRMTAPSRAYPRAPGPSSESLQGRNPRDVGRSVAAGSMGISTRPLRIWPLMTWRAE